MEAWEKQLKFDSGRKAAASNDWESQLKFDSGGKDAVDEFDVPNIVEEQSPLVDAKTRLLLKNLANSAESQVAYLKQQNPDADVRLYDGRPIIKAPGEKDFKVVDPDTGFFSKDILSDVGDLAYDIPAAAVQTASTGVGAAAGTLAAPGAGTMGGAMLASGASSAGLEALRQKLGQAMGIPQDVNMKDVALSGAVGTVSPLVFGAGAPTKAGVGILKKFGEDYTDDAAKAALEKGGQGLGSKAFNFAKEKIAPNMLETMSGIDREAIKELRDNWDEVTRVNDVGVTETVENAQNKLITGLAELKNNAGEGLSQAIDDAGEKVNIAPIKNMFKEKINALENHGEVSKTQYVRDQIKALKDQYEELFKINYADDVWRDTSSAAHSVTTKPKYDIFGKILNPDEVNSQTISKTIGGTVDEIPAQFDDATMQHTSAQTIKTPAQSVSQKLYSDKTINVPARAAGYMEKGNEYIDPLTMNTIKKPTEVSDYISAKDAFKLQDSLRDIAEFSKTKGGPMGPYAGKPTSFDKDFAQLGSSGYGILNDELNRVTGGLSGAHKTAYKQYVNLQKQLQPAFRDTDATWRTLTSLNNKQKRILLERLDRLSKETGIDLSKEARVLNAVSAFGDPSSMPLSSGGVTSTSRSIPLAALGAGAGGYIGMRLGGMPGAIVGASLGGVTGSKFGSPEAVKAYIGAGRYLGQKGAKISPIVNKALLGQGRSLVSRGIYEKLHKK